VAGLATLNDLTMENTLVTAIDCSNSGVARLFCSNNPLLETINLQNGVLSYSDPDMLFFAFRFENLPELISICLDNGEQQNLQYSYYDDDNVVVFAGANCTLSNDDFQIGAVTLYPNPTKGSLNISNNSALAIEAVTIYNILGQRVQSTSVNNLTNITIDVSDLETGNYIVEMQHNAGKTVKKLIKQ
jgi:hypothetical protein